MTEVVDEWQNPRTLLLLLMYRLDIIGMRKVSYSLASMMVGPPPPVPPLSIPLAIVSLSREYLQFVPRRLEDKELNMFKKAPYNTR